MRKEQVLLLALLAALFGPASGQSHLRADEIDDDCHVKTSIVLHKLKTCVKEKTKDGFKRNQLWTDVKVKETMGAMMKQLREDIKYELHQVTNKLENKLEGVMKQAHDDKLEMKSSMDRNLLSIEANKKQMDDLLQGHDKMKSTMDRILQSDETKKKQIEDGMKSNLERKSTMDRTLLSVEANKTQMEDLMKVQSIKERDCQRTLASWSLSERNATLFFKAMGRTFYYDETQFVTWYSTRDWCSSRGMQMATLKTAEEQKQMAYTFGVKASTYGALFWVSASDIGRSPGQFHWADGTPVLKSTWVSGQPDSYKANQETCAFIGTGDKNLYDLPCSDTSRTLCEVPELLATCL